MPAVLHSLNDNPSYHRRDDKPSAMVQSAHKRGINDVRFDPLGYLLATARCVD